MIQQFFVMQMIHNDVTYQINNLVLRSVMLVNPNVNGEPPTFDKYEEAEQWILLHGQKNHFYQIQKYLMPTP